MCLMYDSNQTRAADEGSNTIRITRARVHTFEWAARTQNNAPTINELPHHLNAYVIASCIVRAREQLSSARTCALQYGVFVCVCVCVARTNRHRRHARVELKIHRTGEKYNFTRTQVSEQTSEHEAQAHARVRSNAS